MLPKHPADYVHAHLYLPVEVDCFREIKGKPARMAPAITSATVTPSTTAPSTWKAPLRRTGAIDQYEREDVTPIIGTEFPTAKLADWIKAPNADDLLRDLAILGS